MLVTKLLFKKSFSTLLRTGFFVSSVFASSMFLSSCSTDDPVEPISITTTDADGVTSVDSATLTETLNTLPVELLSVAEADGLVYMREEEKLARDTYIAMYSLWNKNIFNNISNSEQTHTDAVLALLQRYNIVDPVGTNITGVFTNTKLQSLYNTLIAQGSASLIDALIVGVTIEEIDIIDIQEQLDAIVNNQDITIVYENLLKGSRNHLRSFVSNLEQQNFTYTPQYISQEQYDEIINSAIETK